ncbi:uncharacterized protein LOC104440108 [Eucalyptus grandis]|uniref:uncharacterized protein LOC104440108 n=1 Tax=Eucalyptus grandis TaxID=71139 RepID=UPI00192EF188|nr:uncharacterized protein LOC104440108 [Eucalyptus grandis]
MPETEDAIGGGGTESKLMTSSSERGTQSNGGPEVAERPTRAQNLCSISALETIGGGGGWDQLRLAALLDEATCQRQMAARLWGGGAGAGAGDGGGSGRGGMRGEETEEVSIVISSRAKPAERTSLSIFRRVPHRTRVDIWVTNQESNPMSPEPSEKQRKSDHAEPSAEKENQFEKDFVLTLSPTFIEDVRLSVPSDPSQSRGASENFEEEVDEPYYRLLQAAFKGDWESATRFFKQDAASKTAKITSRSETLLHIAALSARDQFLENLVELLYPNPEALEMVDCDGRTALHNAVLCGRIRMVKTLVRSNPKLTQLADKEGRVPLRISALEASMHKDITWFLAKNTTDDGPSHPFSSPDTIEILIEITNAGHHGKITMTIYLNSIYF